MDVDSETSPVADVSLLSPLAADYHILAELERDDLGTVFLAQQLRVGARRIAVRVLPPAAEWDPERLVEFERQVAGVARLHHPSVPVIFECGELPDGTAYLATELAEGETLAARLEHTGPLPASDLLAIVEQCAHALDTGYRAGIEHRDLSVHRIILVAGPEATPEVKLKDFGLAHGEDIRAPDRDGGGEAPGAGRRDRPDVVSLALVTKAMLTGRWPDVQAAEGASAAPPPIPPSLRMVLDQAVDGAECYWTASDFAQTLRAVMTPPASTAPGQPEPAAPAPASRVGRQELVPAQDHGVFERPLDDPRPSAPPPPWRPRSAVETGPPAAILDHAEAEEERFIFRSTPGTRPEPWGPLSSGILGPAGESDGSDEDKNGPSGTEAPRPAAGAAEELAELRTRYTALETEDGASMQELAEHRALVACLRIEHQRIRESLDTVQQLLERVTLTAPAMGSADDSRRRWLVIVRRDQTNRLETLQREFPEAEVIVDRRAEGSPEGRDVPHLERRVPPCEQQVRMWRDFGFRLIRVGPSGPPEQLKDRMTRQTDSEAQLKITLLLGNKPGA
jgi:eukaryotic-like serine/threonine-protein kinase